MDENTFICEPLVFKFAQEVFGIETRKPIQLRMSFIDSKLELSFPGRRKPESFYLKKIAVNPNAKGGEFHLRSDGFAIKFSPRDMYLLANIQDRIEDAKISKKPKFGASYRPTSMVSGASVSAPPRGALELEQKSSGILKRPAETVLDRHSSPTKIVNGQSFASNKRMYTQSPLKPTSEPRFKEEIHQPAMKSAVPEPTFSALDLVQKSPVPLKTYGNKKRLPSQPSGAMDIFQMMKNMKSTASNYQGSSSALDDDVVEPSPAYEVQPVLAKNMIADSSFQSPVKIGKLDTDAKVINPQSAIPQLKSAGRYSSPAANRVSSWTVGSSSVSVAPPTIIHSGDTTPVKSETILGGMRQARMRTEPYSDEAKDLDRDVPSSTSAPQSLKQRPALFASPDNLFRPRTTIRPTLLSSSVGTYTPAKPATTFEGKFEGGIRNLGNTCFMSSVLQALSTVDSFHKQMTSPLWSSIFQELISAESVEKPCEGEKENLATNNSLEVQAIPSVVVTGPHTSQQQALMKSLLHQFQQLLTLLRVKRSKLIDHADIQQFASSQTSSVYDGGYNSRIDSLLKFERKVAVDPVKFRACVVTRQAKYMDYSQQDAQEFLTDLMNDLEEEIISIVRRYMTHAALQKRRPSSPSSETTLDGLNKVGKTPSPASISQLPRSHDGAGPQHSLVDELSNHDPPTSSSAATATLSKDLPTESLLKPSKVSDDESDTQSQEILTSLNHAVQSLKKILPPSLFFESTMSMSMTCSHCRYQHAPKTEQYRDFSLDLLSLSSEGNDKLASSQYEQQPLIQLVRQYMQPEHRDLHCPNCMEQPSQVILEKKITSVAPVLVFQIKRFQYDRRIFQFRKMETPVQFPSRISLRETGMCSTQLQQDPSPFSKISLLHSAAYKKIFEHPFQQQADKSELLQGKLDGCLGLSQQLERVGGVQQGMRGFAVADDTYVLTAVVRHYGASIGVGHYICDVRNHAKDTNTSESGTRWLRYNDAVVTSISEEDVLKEMDTPYLLFYQKLAL